MRWILRIIDVVGNKAAASFKCLIIRIARVNTEFTLYITLERMKYISTGIKCPKYSWPHLVPANFFSHHRVIGIIVPNEVGIRAESNFFDLESNLNLWLRGKKIITDGRPQGSFLSLSSDREQEYFIPGLMSIGWN